MEAPQEPAQLAQEPMEEAQDPMEDAQAPFVGGCAGTRGAACRPMPHRLVPHASLAVPL